MPLIKVFIRPLAQYGFAAGTLLALSGCQTISLPTLPNFSTQSVPGPTMAPAPLPTFYTGDKYYYSNGAREQVVSINGETVNMIRRSKRKVSNFRNFILPSPYIEGIIGEYYKESNIVTNALWPLRVGNAVKFNTEGKTVYKVSGHTSKYTQRWDCSVAGTEHIRVLAGEFDTYKVKCQRFSIKGRWWQNSTWNYAPILGTYVLRRNFYKKNGARIRQLTAIRPSLQNEPSPVRKGIIHAWQTALESKQNGEISSWTDKKTGTSVQVEPIKTYRAENGLFCRTYKEYLTRKGKTRIYAGVACRQGKMQWRTPNRG